MPELEAISPLPPGVGGGGRKEDFGVLPELARPLSFSQANALLTNKYIFWLTFGTNLYLQRSYFFLVIYVGTPPKLVKCWNKLQSKKYNINML